MKKKSATATILSLKTTIKQENDQFEKTVKNPLKEKIEEVDKSTQEKIRKLEDKISSLQKSGGKKVSKIKEKLELASNKKKAKNEPLYDEIQQINRKLSLFSLKNTELKVPEKYTGYNAKNAVLNELHSIKHFSFEQMIVPNRNRVNKYTLTCRITPLSYIMRDIIVKDIETGRFKQNDNGSYDLILSKDFPSENMAKAYLKENFDSVIAPYVEYNNNIEKELEQIDFNYAEELDFRLVAMNYSHRDIVKQQKNLIQIRIGNYYAPDRTYTNLLITIQHAGDLRLIVNMQSDKNGQSISKIDQLTLMQEVLKHVMYDYNPLSIPESQYMSKTSFVRMNKDVKPELKIELSTMDKS